jgi:IMP dehydrogenase/GMP reductase
MIEGLEFKDVLIMPRVSNIKSRNDVDLSHTFTDHGVSLQLEIPLFSAPMEGIVTKELVVALGENGACGILHRGYKSVGDWCRDIDWIASKNVPYGISVGIGDEHNIIDYALRKEVKVICIDVANGYMMHLLKFINSITDKVHNRGALVMSGNVVSYVGAFNLFGFGTDLIRVGIGSGSLCITRQNTGIGCPQFTAIENCKDPSFNLIADGGIKNAGDAMKAFAIGAKGIMLGSLLANCFESGHSGEIRGMASKEYQEEFYGEHKSIEGIVKKAEKTISTKDFIRDFAMNLKSGCSYLGVNKLDDISSVAEFVRVNA